MKKLEKVGTRNLALAGTYSYLVLGFDTNLNEESYY